MRPWTDWEVIRHQVSICGRISGADGNPMGGVEILASPDEILAPASEPRAASRRPSGKVQKEQPVVLTQTRQAESRSDGTFFFLDCPDGLYTVTAVEPRSRKQVQKQVPVAASAMKKNAKDRGPEEGYYIELAMKEV